jgi:quinoprotein glucose dehydrogenase
MKHVFVKFFLVLFGLSVCSCQKNSDVNYRSWRIKGGTADGIQYSALIQINKQNVGGLKVAWMYSAGDADTAKNRSQIQCNPIMVDGIVYGTTPALRPFALDAATGKEIWKFEPALDKNSLGVNRGVTYWADGDDKRILSSLGEYLYCLDAKTGKLIAGFGDHGRVSLKEGLGERAANLMVLSNTHGVIYKNLIILGSRVHEGPIAAPGHLRAFDVKTGKLAWVFHTIPQPGEPGYESWPPDAWQRVGGANAWSGMTVDEKR